MVASPKRCVIISASPELDSDFLKTHIAPNDYLICADGGVDKLIPTGFAPDLIIGDFDSSKNYKYFNDIEVVELQIKKDDTDTLHCAAEAVKRGFTDIVFLGATGGRLDHTLANLSVLLFLQNNNVNGRIVDKFNEVSLLKQGKNFLTNVRGKTISVMPFACFTAVLSYKGMLYPMEDKVVSADFPYTISNIAVDDNVEIFIRSGTALLIIANE